jgi:hypothetical protein
MSLKDRITEDMKAAMRAKDADRLSTIRMLLAACKQREVDERIVLDDAAVVGLVDKLIKQRKDSITAFEQAAAPTWWPRKPPNRGAAGLPAAAPVGRRSARPPSPRWWHDRRRTGPPAGPGDMGKVMAAAKARSPARPKWAWSRPRSSRPWQSEPMRPVCPPARSPPTSAWRRS